MRQQEASRKGTDAHHSATHAWEIRHEICEWQRTDGIKCVEGKTRTDVHPSRPTLPTPNSRIPSRSSAWHVDGRLSSYIVSAPRASASARPSRQRSGWRTEQLARIVRIPPPAVVLLPLPGRPGGHIARRKRKHGEQQQLRDALHRLCVDEAVHRPAEQPAAVQTAEQRTHRS